MNFEYFRLATFNSWPSNAPITKERLAAGGFFYKNEGFSVECFSCHVIIDNWDFGDQVMLRHKNESPNCPLVLDYRLSGNVSCQEVNQEKLKHASVRLKTFVNWPSEHIVKAKDLALCGFYYLNVEDQTKCIRCSEIFWDWRSGDTPRAVHRQHSPRCVMAESSEMELEENRRVSFLNWPKADVIDAERLVQAGFYYLDRGDETKCFSCGGVTSNWEPGDDPDVEHQKFFPSCKYVKDIIHPKLQRENSQLNLHSGPGTSVENRDETASCDYQKSENLAFPEYSNFEDRLKTFDRWSPILEQKPQELSEAGFFYGGRGDLVRCFQCSGGLQEWHNDDIPWVEHAKWFQHCQYVRRNKNQQFIQNCLMKRGADSSISPFWKSAQTKEALALEIDPSLIRRAIIDQVRENGISFLTSEELVDKALNMVKTKNSNDSSPQISKLKDKPPIDLVMENRALKEAKLCKICLDAELEVVFLPCAHFSTCDRCSMLVDECPICRRIIETRLKTYMA